MIIGATVHGYVSIFIKNKKPVAELQNLTKSCLYTILLHTLYILPLLMHYFF